MVDTADTVQLRCAHLEGSWFVGALCVLLGKERTVKHVLAVVPSLVALAITLLVFIGLPLFYQFLERCCL